MHQRTWILMAAAAAATAAAATAIVIAPSVASASVASGGKAVVVGSNFNDALRTGGSKTQFSLNLPRGAACPGDSADANYRVRSFLVPATVDPGTLTYQASRPVVENGWPLYQVDSVPYVNGFTDKAAKPGGPGTIINIPLFNFAVFEPGQVPAGRYHLGIACLLGPETTRFWSTDVTIAADPKDAPAQLTWTAIDAPANASHSTAGRGVLLGLVGAAVVVGIMVVVRRPPRPALSAGRS